MKRGFSATTAILVVLLLGVLVMVGKIVNPPPGKDDHDHGDEQAPSQPAKPVSKDQQIAMKKEQQEKMRAEMKKHQPPAPPKGMAASAAKKKDPLDASLWQESDMGAVTPKSDTPAGPSAPAPAPAANINVLKVDTKHFASPRRAFSVRSDV